MHESNLQSLHFSCMCTLLFIFTFYLFLANYVRLGLPPAFSFSFGKTPILTSVTDLPLLIPISYLTRVI